jgi:hypothetical protein
MKIPLSSSPKIEPILNVATTELPILIILLNMALNYLTPNLLNRKWAKDFCLTPTNTILENYFFASKYFDNYLTKSYQLQHVIPLLIRAIDN